MMAEHPVSGVKYFFFSTSASHLGQVYPALISRDFQTVLLTYVTGKLENALITTWMIFFFIALLKLLCDGLVDEFIQIYKGYQISTIIGKNFLGKSDYSFSRDIDKYPNADHFHSCGKKRNKAIDLIQSVISRKKNNCSKNAANNRSPGFLQDVCIVNLLESNKTIISRLMMNSKQTVKSGCIF